MQRYPALICALALLTLGGCINASNDNGGGATSSGGSGAASGSFFGNGDVTADAQGGHTVNGAVRVRDGDKSGDLSTVNGEIHVGDKATVDGATTVNGSIDVGNHATADALKTVNGSISLDDGARVEHAITSVNGSLTLRSGTEVDGGISNVNGTIRLNGAHVAGGIKTFGGDIYVEGASHVEGGILVQRPQSESWFQKTRDPRVVIGPGSVVRGDLRFERKVELYVSDKATIGPVIGATPVRYSGEGPAG
jgi:cytoskeletal protein CcmA (bactofilin family)